jgi:regulation of enolase protein 1 (concanavalin A-like superfamily)
MSVVAADEWADWSLSPLSSEHDRAGNMTVEMEREREDGVWGSVLRISLVDEKRDKMPIREVTWAFHDLDDDDEILVGAYAAKPTKDERNELLVDFEKFEIEYREMKSSIREQIAGTISSGPAPEDRTVVLLEALVSMPGLEH